MELCRGADPCAERDGCATRGRGGQTATQASADIPDLEPPQDPTIAWKAEAENELLVALRDGDLIAQGRYTEERPNGWGYGNSSGFGLHSGYHTSIRPEQWREGKYSFRRLTARDWEFIDIRVSRFLVKAIWPDYIPEPVRPAQDAADAIYATPYLDLMQAAIAHFGISSGTRARKNA